MAELHLRMSANDLGVLINSRKSMLAKRCSHSGLDPNGTKSQLIERLIAFHSLPPPASGPGTWIWVPSPGLLLSLPTVLLVSILTTAVNLMSHGDLSDDEDGLDYEPYPCQTAARLIQLEAVCTQFRAALRDQICKLATINSGIFL